MGKGKTTFAKFWCRRCVRVIAGPLKQHRLSRKSDPATLAGTDRLAKRSRRTNRLPLGCYAITGGPTPEKPGSVAAASRDSVILSRKDLRCATDISPDDCSRPSTIPCVCKNRLMVVNDKSGLTDCVRIRLSKLIHRSYTLDLPEARARTVKSRGTGVPPVGPSDPSTPNLILIVDDEEDMRRLKGEYLQRLGYRIVEAENGCAGIEMALSERPRLILMNYMMPQMDGLTATEIIRQQPELKDTPIIMNSACDEEEMRPAALLAGCVDYLVEPSSPRELLRRIEANILIG
jgi:CheY-like chemotaxis protein